LVALEKLEIQHAEFALQVLVSVGLLESTFVERAAAVCRRKVQEPHQLLH